MAPRSSTGSARRSAPTRPRHSSHSMARAGRRGRAGRRARRPRTARATSPDWATAARSRPGTNVSVGADRLGRRGRRGGRRAEPADGHASAGQGEDQHRDRGDRRPVRRPADPDPSLDGVDRRRDSARTARRRGSSEPVPVATEPSHRGRRVAAVGPVVGAARSLRRAEHQRRRVAGRRPGRSGRSRRATRAHRAITIQRIGLVRRRSGRPAGPGRPS